MIISFNTGKIQTKGGESEVKLQQKKITITENGLDVFLPDEGYDGISTLYVKTDVAGGASSFKDFSSIGYDDENNIGINQKMDEDLAYSKTLYDNWKPTSTKLTFAYDNKLVYAPLINTENVTDFYEIFRECVSLQYIPKYNTSNVKTLSLAFGSMDMEEIDISIWDTSNVTTVHSLFSGCKKLINGDVSKNDWSSVKDGHFLFSNCEKLKTANVSNFVTGQKSVQGMFDSCMMLKTVVGLDTWNLENVTDFYETFNECRELSNDSFKDVEKWNVVKPQRFTGTFYNCQKLSSLDLSGWKTDTLTSVNSMFTYDSGLIDLNLTGWNMSKITNTSSWFSGCYKLENLQFGYNIKYSFSLSNSSKLSVDSLLSVLNGLYDYVGKGESVPSSSYGKLTLGSTNLAKLSDGQKAIATAKGWTLS